MNEAVRNALKQVDHSAESNTMYRILDKNGLVYSQSLGWVVVNNRTYGHTFSKNELPIVLSILKEHGYTELHTEIDKVGTLFVAAAESPFGNPFKMGRLVVITVIMFALLYVVLSTGLLDAFVALFENQIKE